MDICKYCLKYHNPTEVCDKYIEAIAQDKANDKSVIKQRLVYKGGAKHARKLRNKND